MRGVRRCCVAAAAALAGAAAMLGVAPASAAPAPGYVAIVIAGHGYGCVRWHSGLTGDEVLNDVARVAYRQDGVIWQIDGYPNPPYTDDTHYWSYWHDTGGAWHYSDLGASNYSPAAGTVEGWSWDDGNANASPPPQSPSGLYATLCGGRDVQSPTPRPSTSKPATQHNATHPASRSTTYSNGPATRPASPTHRTTPHRVISTPATPSSSAPPSTSPASTSAERAAAALALPSLPPPSHASKDAGGSWVPATVGGGLAALVGGAALVVGLRRKRAGPTRT